MVPLQAGGGAERPTVPLRRGDPGWEGVWFGIVPGKAATDKRITDGASRCLQLMASWGRQDTKGRPERIFAIAQTTIADRMGRPRQTVNRWIKLLRKCGYLEVVGRTRRPGGGWGANVYRIVGYDTQAEPEISPENARLESIGHLPTAKKETSARGDSSAFKRGETWV